MNEENVNSLIGMLNLGLIIANGRDDDFVHLPVEDATELLITLKVLKEKVFNEEAGKIGKHEKRVD